MADFLTVEQRSRLMARVRGKNTAIELALCRKLRGQGVYFVTHARGVAGHPDIAFRRRKLAIFVDGDFWHGRDFQSWRRKLQPKWEAKITRNIERDRETNAALKKAGWRVLRLWGSDIKKRPDQCIARIIRARAQRTSRPRT